MESFFRNSSQSTGVRDVSSHVAAWTSDNPSVISVGSHGLAIAHQPSGTAVITATIRAPGWPAQISITLTAAPAVLQFITVGPFDSSVGLTGTVNYTAVGHYSDGTTPPFSSPITWGVVSNVAASGNATILSTGTATATATGTGAGVVKITATDNSVAPPVTGSTYLNVGLTSFSISPTIPPTTPPTVPKGDTQQFAATATFGATTGVDITNYVFWTSTTQSVAKITTTFPNCMSCPAGGLASTFAQGTSTIAASAGSVASSNSLVLTVTAPVVNSVGIAPTGGCSPGSVPRGNSCQFTAQAIYSDHTTATVTNSATWSSSDVSCVVISATGLATTLNPPSNPPFPCAGSVNISASFNSVTSNVIAMTVTAHLLTSISISPKNPTQPKGASQQFTVKAHYTDGIVTVPNGGAGSPVWASSNTSVATIGSSTGLASTTNSITGTTNIGATYSGLQASTVFTVTAAALKSIAVTPMGRVPLNPDDGSTSIPIAGTQQFTATGTYTDNSMQDITSIVSWTSSDQNVATISDPNSPGEATGVNAGTLTNGITATDPASSISGSASLTVKAISSLTVSPPSAMQPPGATQQFAATANYGGGVTQALALFGPTWSSNHTNVATVAQNGLATAIAQGAATISAQLGSVICVGVGCGALTVNAPVLQSITVTCDPTSPCMGSGEAVLPLGQTEQMIATGNYSDGSQLDLTQSAGMTWSSTNTGAATIGATTGFLTTTGLGTTTIKATCTVSCPGAPPGGMQGSLALTVTF